MWTSSLPNCMFLRAYVQERPWDWKWRSSYWFVTFVVSVLVLVPAQGPNKERPDPQPCHGVPCAVARLRLGKLYTLFLRTSSHFVPKIGVVADSLTFSLFILVVPFQLKGLGYTRVASLIDGSFSQAYVPIHSSVADRDPYSLLGCGRSHRYIFRQISHVVRLKMLPSTASVPIAIWSEAHDARKSPYVTGILMFMEAPYYWVMCLARCLHGIGSATRMVIGPTVV